MTINFPKQTMTPYEAVREEFNFPFDLYPFQIERVNELAEFPRAAKYHQGGTGKTASSTHWALSNSINHGTEHWVLVVPPILLLQWQRWLGSVTHKRSGTPLSVTVYAGTRGQRERLNLDVDFLALSYGILKNDFARIQAFYSGREYGVIVDEAQATKNIQSQTHKAVKALAEGRPLMMLTGTPLTTPGDAYAYIRSIAPSVYSSHRQFEKLHVLEKDEYEKVTKWGNLDLLAENMKIQTTRVLRREVTDQLPPVTFTRVNYELDPAHLALYKRIADEKLVEFDDGREINAISAQALRAALQQIVLNWGYFDETESREPAGLELVDGVFGELESDGKLVVVANFRMSNAMLLEKLQKYGAVAVYGDVSPKDKQAAIRRFIEDPACRCIILQPQSAGMGVDGLQHVCCDMLILEAPTTAPSLHQVVWRLDRDGQTSPVNVRIGIANQTIQVRLFHNLLENDAVINSVQGGLQDLKDAIHGR